MAPQAKPYIASIAKEFWKKSGIKIKPPYDIFGATSITMPLDIVALSDLSLKKIEDWLRDRNISLSIDINNRSLHGFILTFRGSGFIFINGTDTESERRFTVAHEISHFLLDYKIPRDKAVLKLGSTILEVLDGYREASITERIDGILSSTNLNLYTHLLEKSGDGSFENDRTLNSENDADSLALELLAPSTLIVKETKKGSSKIIFSEFKTRCNQILIEKYGIPPSVSDGYASQLAYFTTGGPSILKKIGF